MMPLGLQSQRGLSLMEPKIKEHAFKYLEMGFNPIPTRPNKSPYLSTWTKYQTEKVTINLIDKWWDTWPKANIALITGEISNLIVIDVDSENGLKELDKISTKMEPAVKSPKGWHYYYQCNGNKTGCQNRLLPDIDIKGKGGLITAPPSVNADGIQYESLIDLGRLKALPQAMLSIINSGFTHGVDKDHVLHGHNRPQVSTVLFEKGTRDEDIFHVANCCIKGGMSQDHTSQVLNILAENCNPPFPKKEAEIKIKSALKRENARTGNLTQEIKEIILSTKGHITSTFVYSCLQLSTRKEKKACSTALGRFVEEGLIERSEKKAGEFRIVNEMAEPIDWKNAKQDWAKIFLPWKLDEFIDIPEGGIVLLMGNPGAGKTAALIYVARYNMRRKWNIHYLSSEISEGAFRKRTEAYKDLSLDDWNVNFYYDPPMVDTIKGGKGNLYILDYIEVYDNFWQIGQMLSDIYKKLNGGVAVIAIQKRPGSDVGLGGQFTQFKPALTLALEWQKVKIVKARDVKDSHIDKYGSPNGKEYHFKMIENRTKYIEDRWWTHPFKENK